MQVKSSATVELADPPGLGGLAAEILDRIRDGFYVIDQDWRLLHANRAACEMWRASRETIVGQVLWERFPELAGSEAGRLLDRAVESGCSSEFSIFYPLARRSLSLCVDPLQPGLTGVFLREVTDRLAAEEAQRANHERLRIASEMAKLGYWERDHATGKLSCSEVCKANYGLPPDADLSYDMVFAAIDPMHRERVREASRRAVREGTDYAAEYPITWPDGTRHWIAVRGRCLYATDGTPLRNVGATLDITERKRVEEALRDSEQRLMLAQEGAGVGIWDWDLVTNEIYWSPQMYRNLDLDPLKDIADLHAAWLRVVHADDRERVRAYIERRRLDRGPSEIDFRIIDRNGTVRWILAKGMAVTPSEDNPMRVAGISIDITERKRIETDFRQLTEELEARVEERTRELAQVNERLRRERLLSELIIENATEGIIVVDTELRHLIWNPAIESINGLPHSEVLGKTLFEVFPHFADHPVGRAWHEAVAGRRAEIREFRFFSPMRGTEIVYDADFAPLYDQASAIIGAICLLRETTERHRMEQMLRQSQKMEAVAQLTGGVAHDFNNLLTAVVGCLDMIMREDKNERIVHLAQTALRSADRGARLTQQLLAFARRQALRPVIADLNQLLSEIAVLLRRAAGETVNLVIDCAPGLLQCELDLAQFEAAALNLVVNARDAMPNGGQVTLATSIIEIRNPLPHVDLQPGEYVSLSVHDTGIGMTADVLARAFEPFYTTKKVGKGSGLGLSMVYGFAKQSGGGVRLESNPGVGTYVTLYLPRAFSSVNAGESSGYAEEPQRGSGTILLVEDDDDVRAISMEMLENLGYRVVTASDAGEALDALRRPDHLDLLFTDLIMPGGTSGLALARQAQLIRPGLRVLLTTGNPGLEASGEGSFRCFQSRSVQRSWDAPLPQSWQRSR